MYNSFHQSTQNIIDHCCRNVQFRQIEVVQLWKAHTGEVIYGHVGDGEALLARHALPGFRMSQFSAATPNRLGYLWFPEESLKLLRQIPFNESTVWEQWAVIGKVRGLVVCGDSQSMRVARCSLVGGTGRCRCGHPPDGGEPGGLR